MGIWDWNEVRHDLLPMADAPDAARVAGAIVAAPTFDDDWERGVFELTRLPQLSLDEWSVCWEVDSIFRVLRDAGSDSGYVVEQGPDSTAVDQVRKIALSAITADKIASSSAMEIPMAFVDEQQLCVLVSSFSDYALFCLREDLFKTWLANNPIDLTLYESDPPYPAASDLKTAREFAQRRRISWEALLRKMHAP